MRTESPRGRRLLWFVGLWAVGVGAAGAVTLLLRGLLALTA